MAEDEDLAQATAAGAADAAGGDGASAAMLEGMDYGKIKFVGVQYDTLEDLPSIGEEVTFLVKGKVVGRGEEAMADGHIRNQAKVKVESVTPAKDE